MGKLQRKENEENIYIMLNKPAGYVTARSDDTNKTIFDLLPSELKENYTLFPVGRLDKDTEGLILITNDGLFNHKAIHAKSEISKTYEFWALGRLKNEYIEKLKEGISINDQYKDRDKITKPAFCKVIESYKFRDVKEKLKDLPYRKITSQSDNQDIFYGSITVFEGRKHEVKRLLKHCECFIVYLKRISIGDLKLDESLMPGCFRYLTDNEINMFLK